jgi:hypothetical protein
VRFGGEPYLKQWNKKIEQAVASYLALQAVVGLQRGRTEARESDPVGPVADADVEATIPYLNPHIRGLWDVKAGKVGEKAPANPSEPLEEHVIRAGFVELWLLP